MNPLLIAHLVADFLFQPDWLVEWKKRCLAGVAAHAAVHAAVMTALIIPRSIASLAGIAIIGLFHAIIDYIKIKLQKNADTFAVGFILDQLAHFAVIAAIFAIIPFELTYWNSEAGQGILIMLTFFSFAFAVKNIMNKPPNGDSNTANELAKFATICSPFAIFTIGAKLLPFF